LFLLVFSTPWQPWGVDGVDRRTPFLSQLRYRWHRLISAATSCIFTTTSGIASRLASCVLLTKRDRDDSVQAWLLTLIKATTLFGLSASLAKQRIFLRSKAQSAYLFWQISTLVTIALGMITTILVSLSSTEFGRDDGSVQRVIRFLAIVFPALGTAAAAAVAFYGPQAEWSQSSRTLASLGQLHGQMGLAVWKLECQQAPTQLDLISVALDDWSKRYSDIQTLASAAGQSNGTGGSTGSGGSGTKDGQSSQKQ
jgi:hypothetical protein